MRCSDDLGVLRWEDGFNELLDLRTSLVFVQVMVKSATDLAASNANL